MRTTAHKSDKLNAVSEGAEILYRRLLEAVDDNGNFDADPAVMLGELHSRCMITRGLTVETISARLKELVDIILVQVYGDGKYLHISNHYTRLRSDGHGSDVRYPKPPATKSRTIPDSEGSPTGDQKASLDLDLDLDLDRDREPSAPVSPDAVDNSQPSNPEPGRRKPRPLNAQAQAVKACLDAYTAGYHEATGKPFDGEPPPGSVVRWLGQQTTRDLGVATFKRAVDVAVAAHKVDPVGKYAFPQRVPLFVSMVSDLLGNWLERARDSARVKREIAEKRGNGGGSPEQQSLLARARRCMDSGNGCPGGNPNNPACVVCPRSKTGSKR